MKKIKNYNQYIKESLLDNLKGPSEEEYLDNLISLGDSIENILYKSIQNGITSGIRYANKHMDVKKELGQEELDNMYRNSAIRNNKDMVEVALECGANVNYFMGDPLLRAIDNDNIEMFKTILNYKINPNRFYHDMLHRTKIKGRDQMFEILYDYILKYDNEAYKKFRDITDYPIDESLLNKLGRK